MYYLTMYWPILCARTMGGFGDTRGHSLPQRPHKEMGGIGKQNQKTRELEALYANPASHFVKGCPGGNYLEGNSMTFLTPLLV